MGRVTGRDVARAAGVSANTVSLVVRQSPQVSLATRAAVRQAMERLGYRPNGLAAALRSRSTPILAFVVARQHVADHVTSGLLAGAIEGAETQGCSVTVLAEDVAAPGRAAEAYRARWAGCAVVLPAAGVDPLWQSLLVAGCPAVALARPPLDCPPDRAVRADDAGGGRLAMAHLLAGGHRHIGIVGLPAHGPGLVADRVASASDTAAQAGARIEVAEAAGWSLEAGAAAARCLLGGRPRPTAIFAISDRLALGVYAAARELGLRIPADLAVAGFDNVEFAAYADPPLTTVDFPLHEIGRRGAALALGAAGMAGAVPTTLIPRASG